MMLMMKKRMKKKTTTMMMKMKMMGMTGLAMKVVGKVFVVDSGENDNDVDSMGFIFSRTIGQQEVSVLCLFLVSWYVILV